MLTDDFLRPWKSVLLPVSTDKPPYLVSLAAIPQGDVSSIVRPEVPLWYPKPNDGLQTPPGYLTASADIPYCFGLELVPHQLIYKSFRGLDAFIPRGEVPRINYGMIGSIMFISRRCGPSLEEALQNMRQYSPERGTGSSEVRTVYMYFDSYVCGERVRTPVVEVQATLIERRRIYGDMPHRIFTLVLWISADSNEYPWAELGDRVFPLWAAVPFLDVRGLRTLILDNTLRAVVVHLPQPPFVAVRQERSGSKKVPAQEDPFSPENIQREIRYICAQSKSPLCSSARTLEDLLKLKISAAFTMPLAYFDYAFVANLKGRDVIWYLEELWNLLFYKRTPIEYEVLTELERLEAVRKDEETIRDMVKSGIVASAGEEGEKKEEKFVPWAVEIPQRVKAVLELVVHPKMGITFAEEIRDFLAFVDRGPLYACRERK